MQHRKILVPHLGYRDRWVDVLICYSCGVVCGVSSGKDQYGEMFMTGSLADVLNHLANVRPGTYGKYLICLACGAKPDKREHHKGIAYFESNHAWYDPRSWLAPSGGWILSEQTQSDLSKDSVQTTEQSS